MDDVASNIWQAPPERGAGGAPSDVHRPDVGGMHDAPGVAAQVEIESKFERRFTIRVFYLQALKSMVLPTLVLIGSTCIAPPRVRGASESWLGASYHVSQLRNQGVPASYVVDDVAGTIHEAPPRGCRTRRRPRCSRAS